MTSSYQAVIIVLHWLGGTIDKQAATLSAEVIHYLLPYNVKFIFPQAPSISVDYHKEVKPAWYNIISPEDLENGETDHGLLDSIEWIKKIISHEISEGILSENIFIAGISQGGSLTLAMAMVLPYKLGGFMTLGGFIPYPKILKKIEREKNKQVPILMSHGGADETVPYEAAQKSAWILQQKGYQIEFKNYAGIGHEPHHFLLMIISNMDFWTNAFQARNLPKGNINSDSILTFSLTVQSV